MFTINIKMISNKMLIMYFVRLLKTVTHIVCSIFFKLDKKKKNK